MGKGVGDKRQGRKIIWSANLHESLFCFVGTCIPKWHPYQAEALADQDYSLIRGTRMFILATPFISVYLR
jgi:hypothetical protein